jgi:hypothetical protein
MAGRLAAAQAPDTQPTLAGQGDWMSRLGGTLPPPPTIDPQATATASLPPAGSPASARMAGQIRGLQHTLQAQQQASPTPDTVDTHPWAGAPTNGTAAEWLSSAGQRNGGRMRSRMFNQPTE